MPMSSSPLISCIVPAFNSAPFVADAVNSVLRQTYRNVEILVVDGGSADNTEEVVRSFGHPVRFEPGLDSSPSATRNRGIRLGKGELFAFLDADDLWVPKKLAVQQALLQEDARLDMVVSHVRFFGLLPKQREQFGESPRFQGPPGYAFTTLLVRRDALEKAGFLREELWYSDSVEWFLRARDLGLNIGMVPEKLTLHRCHGGNLSRRKNEESREEFLGLVSSRLRRRKTRSEGRGQNE